MSGPIRVQDASECGDGIGGYWILEGTQILATASNRDSAERIAAALQALAAPGEAGERSSLTAALAILHDQRCASCNYLLRTQVREAAQDVGCDLDAEIDRACATAPAPAGGLRKSPLCETGASCSKCTGWRCECECHGLRPAGEQRRQHEYCPVKNSRGDRCGLGYHSDYVECMFPPDPQPAEYGLCFHCSSPLNDNAYCTNTQCEYVVTVRPAEAAPGDQLCFGCQRPINISPHQGYCSDCVGSTQPAETAPGGDDIAHCDDRCEHDVGLCYAGAPTDTGEELRLLRELEQMARELTPDRAPDYGHLDVLDQLDALRAGREVKP